MYKMKTQLGHHLADYKAIESIPLILTMVCIYIFLSIERPWESVRYLHRIPIERPFAIVMILIALISSRFRFLTAPSSKWVYMLLALHLALIPVSFNSDAAIDQGIEYGKNVLFYILLLGVAEDEKSLKVLIRAFLFSMLFYMLHSLWEYHNGHHVWRMGISRMVGVDLTLNDPNAFGASIVLSLPFVYALLRTEISPGLRKVYYGYFAIALLCIVSTGSRTASAAFVLLLVLWGLAQKGRKMILILFVVFLSLATVWVTMPAEKQGRIRTLWDKDAGPSNAAESAQGRLVGWKVSWEMFKQNPFTGVGAGGANYIGYRLDKNIDRIIGLEPSPTQSHVLYGEVLAELGIPGALLFAGLVFSIWQSCIKARKKLEAWYGGEDNFLCALGKAIMTSLFLLLFLGLGGHNFYRDLWLWLAAWSGSLLVISAKITQKTADCSSRTGLLRTDI